MFCLISLSWHHIGIFIINYTQIMFVCFFSEFYQFSSVCASGCYITIVYIVMNKGKNMFFRLFYLDNLKRYIVQL